MNFRSTSGEGRRITSRSRRMPGAPAARRDKWSQAVRFRIRPWS